MMKTTIRVWAGALGVAVWAVAGCGGDDTDQPGTTASGTTSGTGTGAGGGGGATGSGGSGGGTTTGTGGGGGAGGGAACVAPADYGAYFALGDPALCVVALYDAADLTVDYATAPSWGRHGGPLTVRLGAAAGSAELVRWTPPAGSTGAMTSAVTGVDAMIPADAFLGAQAVDLPFFGWTAISYTGQGFPFAGEVILAAQGGAVEKRYGVDGYFAAAGLGAAGNQGRLVYTGLSVLGDTAGAVNALYAADSCGTAGQGARLLPEGDASCGAPIEVDAWGDFAGPVTADADGNVIALLPSFAGDQEARGFAAATIARGAPATAGSPLFTLPGSGTSLATISPDGADAGWIAFQPSDPTTFAPLDVVGARYSATSDAVTVAGAPAALLTLATPGTGLALFTDDQDRIWVGAPKAGGGSVLAVVARAP